MDFFFYPETHPPAAGTAGQPNESEAVVIHIFLTGNIQVGKSTIIRKWMHAHPEMRIGGFLTLAAPPNDDGSDSVHIVPASGEVSFTEENRVMLRGEGVPHRYICAFPEVFDRVGTALLEQCAQCSVIIMDEIGTQENTASGFRAAVLRCLDGSVPVLGVVQSRHGVLTDAVRRHPGVEVITVTEENRDGVLLRLLRRSELNTAP